MKIKLSLLTYLLFIPTLVFADVSFTTTSSRSQVNSIAGSANELGIQQPPSSTGRISNNSFASVPQNEQGDGRGQASGEVIVNNSELPIALFGSMQVTASILPDDGEAFSDASVTFAVNKKAKLIVDPGIKQGNHKFLIDLEELPVDQEEFILEPGQHKIEIRVQTTFSSVTNPNFAIFYDISELTDEDDGQGDNDDKDEYQDNANNQIINIKSVLSQIKFGKNKDQIATFKQQTALLTNLRKDFKEFIFGSEIQASQALKSLIKELGKAVKSLKQSQSKDLVSSNKKAVNKLVNKISKQINNV